MNHGDIKLAIDQLDQVDIENHDDYVIRNAVTLIEGLGNKVAEQAVVIEKLRGVVDSLLGPMSNFDPDNKPSTFACHHNSETCSNCEVLVGIWKVKCEAIQILLITKTASKQVLNDWMREQLGEPISYLARPDTEDDYPLDYLVLAADPHPFIAQLTDAFPVYKLPGCLK